MFAAGWIIRGDRMVIADYSHGRAEGQYQYFLFLDGIDMMAQVRWPRAANHYRTATAGIGFGDTVPPWTRLYPFCFSQSRIRFLPFRD
jgi:hypothetical protein